MGIVGDMGMVGDLWHGYNWGYVLWHGYSWGYVIRNIEYRIFSIEDERGGGGEEREGGREAGGREG